MDRKMLDMPFPQNLIKTRQGHFGQSLSYVGAAEYIKRLNDVFEADWSFDVVEHKLLDNEVVVVGKLTAGGVVKTAFGGSSITTSRNTGEVLSIADDLKAAATDALKKACSLLGIGLHLYNDAQPAARSGNGNGNGNGRQKPAQGGNGKSNGNGGNGATNGNRLTQKQLSAIWSMGRSLGLNADAIRQRTQEGYNSMPEHLSKTDASSFIGALGAELSGDGGAA